MEKNINSPLVTIHQPLKNQIINNADSLIIDVDITPKGSSIGDYQIKIMNKRGETVYESLSPCQCADLHFVQTKQSFIYESAGDTSNNSEFVLEICAFLNNGDQICKSVPFKMS
ncbi:hypothetical protein ON006_02120 [Dyadobacter pollutisoli]|uniref:Uncharacterized protein n=2 Tax=Dyadobacter pollutisoli TaxID=2910158 RepID=A0A9E8SKQ9_9BACT|nr:hypothetical protein [Dyadobacter pollutisoli]WAC12765.1 hypothetical protein ON006_02120 [Dyadobacter pollutisoli]